MPTGKPLPQIHERESIHAYIVARLTKEHSLPEPQMPLPDEAPPDPTTISFMAGARDGAFGHHGGGSDETDRAAALGNQLLKTAAKPTKRHLRKLYGALNDDAALDYVDPLIERLAHRRPPTTDIARIGTWLAAESPDRGPVKIGIALLGITGAQDGALIQELGAHEEFTLFSSVAFSNSRADPEPELFKLARAVTGWGRIHCIERLKDTKNEEIRRWILLDGFRNTVMYEYLAHIAATTGDLAGALAVESPGRDLLTAAGEIIQALLMGGPAEDIDEYNDAPAAIERYLGHMGDRASSVADFLTVSDIQSFLEDENGWEARLAGLWSEQTRSELSQVTAEITGRDEWLGIVTTDLDSEDRQTFWRADQAARVLGIDTFDRHLKSIESNPLDGTWYQAWELADGQRAQLLAARAAVLLDLEAIASGPSTAIGLGPDFKPHAALGWSLQGIKDHPSVGSDLVAAALASPSIQNRNGAMNALEAWGQAHWSAEHVEALRLLASQDPHEKARERAKELVGRFDAADDGGT